MLLKSVLPHHTDSTTTFAFALHYFVLGRIVCVCIVATKCWQLFLSFYLLWFLMETNWLRSFGCCTWDNTACSFIFFIDFILEFYEEKFSHVNEKLIDVRTIQCWRLCTVDYAMFLLELFCCFGTNLSHLFQVRFISAQVNQNVCWTLRNYFV